MRSSIILGGVAMALLFGAGSAQAACGNPLKWQPRMMPKLPPAIIAQARQHAPSDASIVGLWHVTYTSEGSVFYEAFDEWHNDGTEFENAFGPPQEGNICFGAWAAAGERGFTLSHIGWSFDNSGNPAGTFTISEANTVARTGNTYKGSFDFKLYDLDGNLLGEVTGTQKGERLSAQ